VVVGIAVLVVVGVVVVVVGAKKYVKNKKRIK
jgi:hypothetical protein